MDETEILEFILAYLPETFEGWAGLVMAGCAILSLALPAPAENAHPLIRFGHRLMCIVGLGAGKLRTAGPRKGDAASVPQGGFALSPFGQRLRSKLGKVATLLKRPQGRERERSDFAANRKRPLSVAQDARPKGMEGGQKP